MLTVLLVSRTAVECAEVKIDSRPLCAVNVTRSNALSKVETVISVQGQAGGGIEVEREREAWCCRVPDTSLSCDESDFACSLQPSAFSFASQQINTHTTIQM